MPRPSEYQDTNFRTSQKQREEQEAYDEHYFYYDGGSSRQISQQVDYLLRIRDLSLRRQFEQYGIANQSPIFPLACGFLGLFGAIPLIIILLIVDLEASRYNYAILVLIVIVTMFVSSCSGFGIYHFHHKLKLQSSQLMTNKDLIKPGNTSMFEGLRSGSISDLNVLENMNETKTWLKYCNHVFIFMTHAFLVFLFARRSLPALCHSNSHGHQHILSQITDAFLCGDETDRSPLDAGFALMVCPLFMLTLFPCVDMYIIWLIFFASASSYALITSITGQMPPLVSLMLWYLVSFVLVADSQMKNVRSFFINRKLQDTLKENQVLADEYHANEMRFVIANVAHDLKTPLTSFTTGLDLIKAILDEGDDKQTRGIADVKTCFDLLASVRKCLHSIQDTNSFMLMTINRCTDYAKATKGVQLVPLNETIDLSVTIDMPVKCMKNIQDRVNLITSEIPEHICPSIIADKQWLQENLLCLLSNAIKYTSQGAVTLTVSLVPIDQIDRIMYPERYCGVRKAAENDHKNDHCQVIVTNQHSQSPCFDDVLVKNFSISSKLSDCGNQVNSNPSQKKPASGKIVPVDDNFFDGKNKVLMNSRLGGNSNYVGHATFECSNLSSELGSGQQQPVPKQSLLKGDIESCITEEGPNTSSTGNLHILFEVEDNGIGMSEAEMTTLFRPFQQTQRLTGGTGLGLFSLARRLDAIQGKYGVRNRRDGNRGSLFWFTIPYRPDHLSAGMDWSTRFVWKQQTTINHESSNMTADTKNITTSASMNIPDSDNRYVVGTAHSVPLIDGASPEQSPAKALSPPVETILQSTVDQSIKKVGGKPLSILLVDDSLPIIKMTTMMLKRLGHVITSAENGEEAVRIIEERWLEKGETFDVVLMDLQMPVMDGFEATRRIRFLESPPPPSKHNSGTLHNGSCGDQSEVSSSSYVPSHMITSIAKMKRRPPHHLIIGISANSDPDTAVQALKAGMDEFVGKPFTVDTFKKTIQSFLSQ